MSIEVMTLVFKRKLGSVTRKAVLLAMADAANDDGSGVWKSADSLADQCDLSKRTVLRTWKELEVQGLIKRVGFRSVRGGEVIIWALDTRAISRLDRHESRLKLPDDILSPGDTLSPLKEADPVTLCPRPGDTVSPKPSLEPSYKNKGRSDHFEAGWKLYQSAPLKAMKQTKKLARSQWDRAVKRGEADDILRAVQAEVDLRRSPDGFVPALPDMYRWLRDDCWQDVLRDHGPQPAEAPTVEAIRAAMRDWVDTGRWLLSSWSPAPDKAGCRVDPGLLRYAAKQVDAARAASIRETLERLTA